MPLRKCIVEVIFPQCIARTYHPIRSLLWDIQVCTESHSRQLVIWFTKRDQLQKSMICSCLDQTLILRKPIVLDQKGRMVELAFARLICLDMNQSIQGMLAEFGNLVEYASIRGLHYRFEYR